MSVSVPVPVSVSVSVSVSASASVLVSVSVAVAVSGLSAYSFVVLRLGGGIVLPGMWRGMWCVVCSVECVVWDRVALPWVTHLNLSGANGQDDPEAPQQQITTQRGTHCVRTPLAFCSFWV